MKFRADERLDRGHRFFGLRPANLDLDAYTTNKALDGLFALLAEEERKIRKDPAKRTTRLLRRVFGV